jgi:hypothetical protein
MNSQKIDKWFNLENSYNKEPSKKNLFEKKICYLIWKSDKEYLIEWLDQLPKEYNCLKEVNLRYFGEKITFIGFLEYNQPCEYIYLNEDLPHYFCRNKSFLKSHFQKCIRRGLIRKSLLTGYLWWEENLSDFLRRLPIIMIEDVSLFKEVEIIIWFMVMLDQINIPETFKSWLGNVIISLAKYPKKIFNGNKIEKTNFSNLSLLTGNQKQFIYSLMIRRSYGGMKGDMKMINFTIEDYINRIQNGYIIPSVKIKKYTIFRTLQSNDFELSGLDFHCLPKMLDLIHQKFPQYSKLLIKSTIWQMSSKFNFREIYSKKPSEILECWKTIQKTVLIIQKQYIRRYIVEK